MRPYFCFPHFCSWFVLFFFVNSVCSNGGTNAGGHIDVRILADKPSPRRNQQGISITSTTKKSILDEEDDYDDYKDEEELEEMDYITHDPAKDMKKEWTSISCPITLEGRCHCGHQRDPRNHSKTQLVVNCTHAGFTDSDFFKHVPEETEILIVRGNHLTSLPSNLFGDKPMEHLRQIDLADNEIHTMKGKTFHHVPNVETLILNFNKLRSNLLLDHPRLFSNFYSLRSLHLTGAFEQNSPSQQREIEEGLRLTFLESNMSRLEKLHLEQNRLSRIPNPREFCELRSLMDLHLGMNELTDISLDLDNDDCLPLLRYVDLSHNHIRTITSGSGVFQLMIHKNQRGEPVMVELLMNPFHCDCELEPFLTWLKNTALHDPDQIRHRTQMRCKTGFPMENKDIILFSVNKTECEPRQFETTNEVIDRLSMSVVSIILISLALLAGFLYVKVAGVPSFIRGLCSHNLRNPLITTTTGVKYTSVDKEEVAEVAHV